MISHKFLKVYFSNLNAENDKTAKKRNAHFWLITLESDQRQSINLISSNKKRQTHSCFVLVINILINKLKSEYAKTTK